MGGALVALSCIVDRRPALRRLQTGRTQWYCKMLLLFTALFVCKHGAATAADSVERVQPGLFNQLLQNVRPTCFKPKPEALHPNPPPTAWSVCIPTSSTSSCRM